jgi:hypothetical protein
LRKGDIIGQGIIKKYEVTDDDKAEGERTGGFGSTSMIGTNSAQMAIDPTTAISRGVRANAGIYDEACNIDIDKCIKEAIVGKTLFGAGM